MVLLSGKNYDFSGQEISLLTVATTVGVTSIKLENTEGLADDDYLLINPGTEISEVIKIGAAVSSNTDLTVSALKFAHRKDSKVYRLAYNQMKFYESDAEGGTYAAIVGATVDMDFAKNQTNYEYPTATEGYYYKRTFYNETTLVESAIANSIPWQTDEEELYATPEELQMFLQFDNNDYPSKYDMRFFIKISQIKLGLDLDSSSTNVLFIGTLLLAKAYILRGLATRAVSKGYIQVNAEGRNITKAYQELVLEAENVTQEYKEFILANGRREATSTNFYDDTTQIDSLTRQDIINIMTGESNVEDYQRGYRFSYFNRRRPS